MPGFTYTLLATQSVFVSTGGATYPPQILLPGLSIDQAVDVGTLILRDGCHLRGRANGVQPGAFTAVAVCESRLFPDGNCLPVCNSVLPDVAGGFDMPVLPGL